MRAASGTAAVLGLDPSLTASGLALPNGTFATIRTTAKGMLRLEVIEAAVAQAAADADVIVMEGYSMASGHGAHQLGELGGVLRLMLWRSGKPYVEIAPTRLKKWATGKGNADKDAVLVRAARRWPVADNNQADAAWLKDMGDAHYSGRDLTKAEAQILGQIEWPAVSPTPAAAPWDPSTTSNA